MTYMQTNDRKIYKQTVRKADRQTDRQTDRQIDMHVTALPVFWESLQHETRTGLSFVSSLYITHFFSKPVIYAIVGMKFQNLSENETFDYVIILEAVIRRQSKTWIKTMWASNFDKNIFVPRQDAELLATKHSKAHDHLNLRPVTNTTKHRCSDQ